MTISYLLPLAVAFAWLPSHAQVIINEIMYHPPDGAGAVEFIELHNSGSEEVDVSGWKFTKGIDHRLKEGSIIPPHGYYVLAHSQEDFKTAYGFDPSETFSDSLKKKGEKLELSNRQGTKVDSLKFKDSAPWPLSPDGDGTSLERICPEGATNDPKNWAPGPFGADATKGGGTPGKENASYSRSVPPTIGSVTFVPPAPRPNQPVTVTATIDKPAEIDSVRLIYRVARPGLESAEESVSLKPTSGTSSFSGSIPGQAEDVIVRFRVEAIGRGGAHRIEPPPYELQPAISYFVHDKFQMGKIPFGLLFYLDPAGYKKEEERPKQGNPGVVQGDNDSFRARMIFEMNTDLTPIWTDLCLTQHLSHAQLARARPGLAEQFERREQTLGELQRRPAPPEPLKLAQERADSFHQGVRAALAPILNEAQQKALVLWQESKTNRQPENFTAEKVLQRFCNIEGATFYLTTSSNLSEGAFAKIRSAAARSLAERDKLLPRVRAAMQGQNNDGDNNLINDVRELDEKVGTELVGALEDDPSRKAFKDWRESQNPFRGGPGGSRESTPMPARGENAFIYVSAQTGEPELFDFIKADSRNAGYKVHFAKNHTLRKMSAINLIFEYRERFVLAEPLAYEVYRRAGNAAEQTEFVRLSVNGRPLAYHLLIEQPNRAFLKRNKIRDDGNLYKILWYENGVVRQHEKKTNLTSTHEDVEKLVDSLEKTKGDEQWTLIKSNFNVEQVATYFAVNMVLSHWDGFFNNYFAYHDLHGTGKWEMYPWDQDKTWGFHDALEEGAGFFDMPLTFGMEGDRPPGYPADRPPPRGVGHSWWRAGGFFSKPLLANAEFRKVFLKKTREILDNVYTEKVFFPVIDGVADQLREEVNFRAEVLKQRPEEAQSQFQRDLNSLKEHLTKRREFLLSQEELKTIKPL